MVKKLFALASVTALTGLMVTVASVGCSSTTDDGGGTADSGPGVDASKGDAKTPNPGDDEEPAPSTECKGKIEVDATKLPWKSPNVSAIGSCSQKELDDLNAFLKGKPDAKYSEWKTAIPNAACSACVFGKDADATWAPLLENDKGELVGLNVGGCIAIASGNDKCGQAYQNWFDCGFEACADCPADDSDAFGACRNAANKYGCKKAIDDVIAVCGAPIDDAEKACDGTAYVFEGPIKAQCIGLTEGGGG